MPISVVVAQVGVEQPPHLTIFSFGTRVPNGGPARRGSHGGGARFISWSAEMVRDSPRAGSCVDGRRDPAALKDSIAAGSPSLDNVVRFTAADYEHVFSVTKSVLSMYRHRHLRGLIRDLQQPLSDLLPQYRRIMKPSVEGHAAAADVDDGRIRSRR